MSVADEILRIQQAKSDLATSIAAKGVTVPSATTIDGYAALVDQIQTGGSYPSIVEIEYLESYGTQYIDTKIKPDSNTGIKAYVYNLSSSDLYILGQRNDSGNTRWIIGHNPSSGFYMGYGDYAHWKPAMPLDEAVVTLNYNNDKKFTVTSGSAYREMALSSSLSFTPAYNIKLFGYYGYNASNWTGRMYYVKVTQGSTLTLDLIPVRIGQFGYMYDKVSGVLFGNAGSGNFILGPDVT